MDQGSLKPEANILNNENLYTKSASTILSYLRLQYLIASQFSGGKAAKMDDKYLMYQTDCSKLVAVIFSTTYSVVDKSNPSSLNISDDALKSLPDVEAQFEQCFGEHILNEKEAIDVAMIFSALDNGKKETVIEALKYLAVAFGSDTLDLISYVKKYKEVAASGDTILLNKLPKLQRVFSTYDIRGTNVINLIDQLAKNAKLTK